MSQITFRGAFLRYADLRFSEAGVFCRLHFSSDLSDPVMEAMEWEAVPECIESPAKLTGELVGHDLVLKPNGHELAEHEVQTECSSVEKFEVVKTENPKTRAIKTELRFTVLVRAAGAIALFEDYLRVVGQKPGQLKVGYAEQTKLDLQFDEAPPISAEQPTSPKQVDEDVKEAKRGRGRPPGSKNKKR